MQIKPEDEWQPFLLGDGTPPVNEERVVEVEDAPEQWQQGSDLSNGPTPSPLTATDEELTVASAAQARLNNALSYVKPGLQTLARTLWTNDRVLLSIVVLFTVFLSSTLHDPLVHVFKVSACASPLSGSFTFCRRAAAVVVMHDFAALGQLHTMTLSNLYDGATTMWKLSDELAHSARVAKELAYYTADSSLPSRDAFSVDLHKTNKVTKAASDSLYKLTVG